MLKRSDPSHDVVVIERNGPSDTFGFGVVFSDRTMQTLAEHDSQVSAEMLAAAPQWEAIELRRGGGAIRSQGHGFSSIARKRLLQILQRRAQALGVTLRYHTEIASPSDLPPYDLLVGADGGNSLVRRWYADELGPSEEVGAAKYIWCGSTKRFDCLTFMFVRDDRGAYAVHAYPYDDEQSTFLVETDVESWRNAGLDRGADDAAAPGASNLVSLRRLEELFAEQLEGGSLIGNNSKWLNFRTIRNDRWWHGNVALLGDAAHTAHFSVGSGTKMALEDAIALAAAIGRHADLPVALEAYERERRPAVERLQETARASIAWWEGFGALLDLDLEQLAFNFLTRNPRLTRAQLERRDPALVRAVDAWWASAQGLVAQPGRGAASALEATLALRGVTLPSRIAAAPAGDLVEAIAAAQGGAGLVFAALPPPGEALAPLQQLTEAVHARTAAAVGVRLGVAAAAPRDTVLAAVANACAAAVDLVELDFESIDDVARRDLPELLAAVRRAWPESRPLAVSLPAAGPSGAFCLAARVALAGVLCQGGVDLVSVTGAGDWRHLLLSERIRLQLGVPTMLVDAVSDLDAAETAVLAGRADICLGRPLLSTTSGGGSA